jgi:hypothetical protein
VSGWNGYGLSFWRCKCGAARRVTGLFIRGGERIESVKADSCKRCGTDEQPAGWPSDPWFGFEEAA